jgi:hypothetical protein
VTFIIMQTGNRTPVGELEIRLCPFQSQDRRFLIDREEYGVLWRGHCYKVGIAALATGLAARQIDFLRP